MGVETHATLMRLTSNLSGRVRRVTVNGREYIVAPVTMIVPGILNGSAGPLYYPVEEIQRNYGAWNGVPLTVYHPVRNGQNVSASTPGIWESQGVGFVKNVQIRRTDNALIAEGWFDVARTRRQDIQLAAAGRPTIMPRLSNGQPIELSTGLFTDNVLSPLNYRDHRGQPYKGMIARNHRPDHLAVLPDQRGACSLSDGCGVLANSAVVQQRVYSYNNIIPGLATVVKKGLTKILDQHKKSCAANPEQPKCQPLTDNQSPLANIFCATGKGGGVDPSCPTGSVGSVGGTTPTKKKRTLSKEHIAKLQEGRKKGREYNKKVMEEGKKRSAKGESLFSKIRSGLGDAASSIFYDVKSGLGF